MSNRELSYQLYNKLTLIITLVMGSSNSSLYDLQGNLLNNRKCMILLTSPSFQTSKLLSLFPVEFSYKYVSVGQLIRDQLNKKTRYSEMIMESLQKNKKIDEKILQILLKNTALQGNFMIQFCPKDSKDLVIWEQFIKKVEVVAVIIIEQDEKQMQIPTTNQVKQVYAVKLKQHRKNIAQIQSIVDKQFIHFLHPNQNIIIQKILELAGQKKGHKKY